MLPSPTELRQKTDSAIAAAEQRRLQKIALVKAENERKQREAELRAEEIIAQIPAKCASEAENQRSHAIVMSLNYSEYETLPGQWNQLTYDRLKGAGSIVWNACQAAQLQPTLEYWHDGCGMESGFNIVVHW